MCGTNDLGLFHGFPPEAGSRANKKRGPTGGSIPGGGRGSMRSGLRDQGLGFREVALRCCDVCAH